MELDGGHVLVIGKAVIWFALPIAFVLWDMRALARERKKRQAAREGSEGRSSLGS
ncbi:MAG: hypothetical protein AAF184_09875 [Pseudomonadota bacterium]